MTTVHASCPTCGDIETTTTALVVLRCSSTGSASYAFACPVCRLRVVNEASEAVVTLLVDAGTEVRMWCLPAELDEAKPGPPVTHDDLLAFHLDLAEPGWLEGAVDWLRARAHARD